MVIVGAGVAGMACAMELKEKAIPYVVVEASDGPGGRVRTDKVSHQPSMTHRRRAHQADNLSAPPHPILPEIPSFQHYVPTVQLCG